MKIYGQASRHLGEIYKAAVCTNWTRKGKHSLCSLSLHQYAAEDSFNNAQSNLCGWLKNI